MIESLGGPLWQWDTGRVVKIKPRPGCTVDEVTFFNGITPEALCGIIQTCDNFVTSEIPNSFLQSANNLTVYVGMTTARGRKTTESCVLRVNRREKPSGYVYTETEVKTWADLNERISALERSAEESVISGVTILIDRTTGEAYTLYVDGGKLSMKKGGGDGQNSIVLVDQSTEKRYTLYIDGGKLSMVENIEESEEAE